MLIADARHPIRTVNRSVGQIVEDPTDGLYGIELNW